jgi:acyl-CoA thioester hydrolase
MASFQGLAFPLRDFAKHFVLSSWLTLPGEAMFERRMIAGWGDMDFNGHMRNTAYLDKSADLRMMFFEENGFPMKEFIRLRIGPVIMRDEIDYAREIALMEELRGTLELAGMAADGSRFLIRNTFYRLDGKMAARVNSSGGWLDLNARKLIAPPEALVAAMRATPRTDDFRDMPSSLK